jgi:acetyl esterase/lipase
LILSLPIVTLLLYKLIPKEHKKILKSITFMGIILTVSLSLPFLTAPVSFIDANNQFADAFGRNWNEFHPAVEDEFLDMQQVLIESWFGDPEPEPDSWRLDSNHVYNETDEYKLKYDVYYPGPTGAQFIGEKATIIFMHGGGNTFGDKTNNIHYFRYFAAQGYVVFSINYRLLEAELSPRESRVGDYNIEDLMEDVARFTQFLALNEEEEELVHGADLDNVFLMGNSAGARLAGIAGFGYNDDEWGLHKKLKIRGICLFYPPNSMKSMGSKDSFYYQKGFTKYKNIEDDPDFFDSYTPSKLVDKDDPPCLIFQGTSDSLVSPKNAEEIKKAGKREDVDVIVVSSYFIGHTHDWTVFFTTMAIYYMERFMYLIKED